MRQYMSRVITAAIVCGALLAQGAWAQGPGGQQQVRALQEQVAVLESQVTMLQQQLAELQAQTRALQQHLATGSRQELLVRAPSGRTDETRGDWRAVASGPILIESPHSLVLKSGQASIVLRRDGDIVIEGRNIDITASGKLSTKASGETTIKGSKIRQN
jgi:hypothetical protein